MGNYKKKTDKGPEASKGAGARKPFGIPKYQHFPKASLAPYPDEEGNALWLGDNESLQELLSPSNILASRSPKNSEMLARPGMAISLSAAAIHVGAKEFLEGKGAKALEKMPRFFETSSGKELLSAVKTLNLGKSGSASRSALKKAVKKYIDFMQADNEDLQKALVRVVNTASRAYLLAMHLLEQRAFFLKTGSWAKKWKRSGKEPSEIKAWLKDPSNTDKLTAALVDTVLQKIKHGRKKAKDGDSGESDDSGKRSDSGTSGAAAASNASSSQRRKKTSKKDKKNNQDKKDKKAKKSSDSSSCEKNKNRNRSRSKPSSRREDDKEEGKEKRRSKRRTRSASRGKDTRTTAEHKEKKEKKGERRSRPTSRGRGKQEKERGQRSRSCSSEKIKSAPKPKQPEKKDLEKPAERSRRARRSRSPPGSSRKNAPKIKEEDSRRCFTRRVCTQTNLKTAQKHQTRHIHIHTYTLTHTHTHFGLSCAKRNAASSGPSLTTADLHNADLGRSGNVF